MRQQKSIEPQALLPLIETIPAGFICLQPKPQLEALEGKVFVPNIQDFANTAAIITHLDLDLVLCVDTAIAHLAGGMGHPVWIMMRHEGAPFFGVTGEAAPWYPSARVLRQTAPGDWSGVLGRVRERLGEG